MATTPVVLHAVDPAVSRIDLSTVRHHLTRSPHAIMSPHEWLTAESEYRQFLTLRNRFPGRLLIPSGTTLSIWQAHILDTRAYRADCETAFGRYLDHFPYLGESDPADRAEHEIGLRNLRQLVDRYYGPPYATASSTAPTVLDAELVRRRSSAAKRMVILVALPWQQPDHQAMPLGHASIVAKLRSHPQLEVSSAMQKPAAPRQH